MQITRQLANRTENDSRISKRIAVESGIYVEGRKAAVIALVLKVGYGIPENWIRRTFEGNHLQSIEYCA